MAEPHVIVDGHEDIAFGSLAEGRDYLLSAREIRAREAEAAFENPNGTCMLGLADWLEARIAVIFATVLSIPREHANPGELSYPTLDGAHVQGLAQVDLYRRWSESCPQLELVTDSRELDEVLASWSADAPEAARKVGFVLLMESAEAIREPAEVADWAERGIRMIGPAWQSNRYTGDTHDGGPLTPLGRDLLKAMGTLGLTLDLTHMSDRASLEALESYEGPIVATHANSRRTVDTPRLLSDRVIEGIVAREGVIGMLPVNWALVPGWTADDGKEAVTLEAVVDAIDAVCQIAGGARCVGIGTDFDGGLGSETAPAELDTIADLPKLALALAARGFDEADVDGIMGGNWLAFLKRSIDPRPA